MLREGVRLSKPREARLSKPARASVENEGSAGDLRPTGSLQPFVRQPMGSVKQFVRPTGVVAFYSPFIYDVEKPQKHSPGASVYSSLAV
ncbi:hypothetical protein ROHU_018995 [Labeo rohita]|uniref:Uncharacterized protein n=1 Tax=Labeo rohita TaxID=84645 RepID=A0A498NES2_LABRO|nr:hypothetical protein ROHU_018995 [Labeo rohita]